jgi:hypothetical protein
VSSLEARVRLREGLHELLADGRAIGELAVPTVRNRLLDHCGSDHRSLVELLELIGRHLDDVPRTPLDAPQWHARREALVERMAHDAFIERDAARWAIETIHYAHGSVSLDQLDPVRPFESVALAQPQLPRLPRRVVTASTTVMPRGTSHAASPLHGSTASSLLLTPRMAVGATLRFGQPWYAVQNGNALVALPSPARGPRRPPPIAPISNVRVFAGWTRETFALGGVLGAVTLAIAFAYWLMLNAARDEARSRLVSPNAGSMLVLPPPPAR